MQYQRLCREPAAQQVLLRALDLPKFGSARER